MKAEANQQIHGYKSGHQLLTSNVKLARSDQDVVDRLSDMAGQLRPGETFKSYLSAYPLPSKSKFVLARTWQDIGAPRAGCVLTRSLFVDMDEWKSVSDIQSLLTQLTPVKDGATSSGCIEWFPNEPLPPLRDSRTVEIVEALFLEERQPLVVIDFEEAELAIARMLTALWPAARANFSACSFSLAPRRIEGRDFDLLFSTRSARSRFSDWSGRLIENAIPDNARHRWSRIVANEVFLSPKPSFLSRDPLGVLTGDLRGEEGALRLTLMWNELVEKAESSPVAVLGMLDILNLLGAAAGKQYPTILDLAVKAVEQAKAEFAPPQAWRFLSALAQKWPSVRATHTLHRRMKEVATEVTTEDRIAALSFLAEEKQGERAIAPALVMGIGDGLTCDRQLGVSVEAISADVLLDLMLASDKFAAAFLHVAEIENARSAIETLAAKLSDVGGKDRSRLRTQLLPKLNADLYSDLLRALLSGSTDEQLIGAGVTVAKVTQMRLKSYDAPLIDAARTTAALQALRSAVAATIEGEGADRFLLSALSLERVDIEWLASGAIKPERGAALLASLLASQPDRSLIAIQRDTQTRKIMLNLLLSDAKIGAYQTARLLRLGEFGAAERLDIGFKLLPFIEAGDHDELVILLLEEALKAASPNDDRVAKLITMVPPKIDGGQLIRWAAVPRAATGRVGCNLILFDNADVGTRTKVVSKIDELTRALILRGNENLGVDAYAAWGALVEDAGQINQAVQLRAATQCLLFALAHLNWPMGALVVASFRHVYRQIARSKRDSDYGFLPSLFALPMSFLMDWDRAKEARIDLVEGFLKSGWRPTDLVLAASGTGDELKILRRLSRTRGGERYIASIEKEAASLQGKSRETVQRVLKEYRKSRTLER